MLQDKLGKLPLAVVGQVAQESPERGCSVLLQRLGAMQLQQQRAEQVGAVDTREQAV